MTREVLREGTLSTTTGMPKFIDTSALPTAIVPCSSGVLSRREALEMLRKALVPTAGAIFTPKGSILFPTFSQAIPDIEICSRRDFLKAVVLAAAAMILPSCGPTDGNRTQLQPVPKQPNVLLPIDWTKVPADIPREFIESAYEARQNDLIQTAHGGPASMLISEDLLLKGGTSPSTASYARGTMSFKAMYTLDIPEAAFARKQIFKGDTPRMTNSTNLWVAISRPTQPQPYDVTTWRESRTHANYVAHTRAFEPIVNEKVIASLNQQIRALEQALLRGNAPRSDVVTLERLAQERELQLRRFTLWRTMSQAERELITTPAVFDWHLESKALTKIDGLQTTVKSGYLPFSDLKRVYIPDSISKDAELRLQTALRKYSSDASIVKVKPLISSPAQTVSLIEHIGQQVTTFVEYLPFIGFVLFAVSPIGTSIVDLNSTMDQYEDLNQQGKTNFTLHEYTGIFNHFDQIAKWTGWDFVPHMGEAGVDRSWESINLVRGQSIEQPLMVRKGDEVYEPMGQSSFLGLNSRYFRKNMVDEDTIIIPKAKIEYVGDGSNSPIVRIEFNGKTIIQELTQPDDRRDLGPYLGPDKQDDDNFCFQAGGKKLATVLYPLRYIRYGPQSISLYMKPVIVQDYTCPPSRK